MFRKDTWDPLIIRGVNMSLSSTAAPLLLEEYMMEEYMQPSAGVIKQEVLQDEAIGGGSGRRLQEEAKGEG